MIEHIAELLDDLAATLEQRGDQDEGHSVRVLGYELHRLREGIAP